MQIAIADGRIYALRSDGAIFHRPLNAEDAGWEEVPPIPKPAPMHAHDGMLFRTRLPAPVNMAMMPECGRIADMPVTPTEGKSLLESLGIGRRRNGVSS